MKKSSTSIAEKLALMGGAASLALCSGTTIEAAIVASPHTPASPPASRPTIPGVPFPLPAIFALDVDGNGTNDFQLTATGFGTARFLAAGGSKFVKKFVSGGEIAKLWSGFEVGGAWVFPYNLDGNGGIVTGSSQIGGTMARCGWAMGDTGFFGFTFFSSGAILSGWGEMVIDPPQSGTRGYEFEITRMYYEDSGAPIAVGDTGGAGTVPEPSTCALALLAAGGVAAYRARRKVAAV